MVISGGRDLVLPSVEEGQRLKKTMPRAFNVVRVFFCVHVCVCVCVCVCAGTSTLDGSACGMCEIQLARKRGDVLCQGITDRHTHRHIQEAHANTHWRVQAHTGTLRHTHRP